MGVLPKVLEGKSDVCGRRALTSIALASVAG